MTTSEQQAVPVAQIDWRLIAKAAGEHGVRYRTNTALLAFLAAIEPALPCKSGEGAGAAIPADIAEHVLSLGRVEWGQTHAHDADGHGRHVADSVRITAANFGQDGDQHMHGLWLAGTETVLCHTGTSPNAPKTTQALVGAWNWLVDQASGAPVPDATQTREAEGVFNPIRVDWNKHDLAEAYDLVEGVRRAAAQHPDNPLDTSLCAALDAIEAADCEWDGMTKE